MHRGTVAYDVFRQISKSRRSHYSPSMLELLERRPGCSSMNRSFYVYCSCLFLAGAGNTAARTTRTPHYTMEDFEALSEKQLVNRIVQQVKLLIWVMYPRVPAVTERLLECEVLSSYMPRAMGSCRSGPSPTLAVLPTVCPCCFYSHFQLLFPRQCWST